MNLDGGGAWDPETGMMYVGSQSGKSTIRLQKDPCSEFRYSSPRDNCGLIGALPPLLVYFFGGKYFVRGLTQGAIK